MQCLRGIFVSCPHAGGRGLKHYTQYAALTRDPRIGDSSIQNFSRMRVGFLVGSEPVGE
jgi:hypothetical protein